MKTVWSVLAASLTLLALAACGDKSPPRDEVSTGPRLVKALKVGVGEAAEPFRYTGEIRARHETQLAFRVGGKLTSRLVDAGIRVNAGQALARLDPADLQLAVTQAEANHVLAAAELKRTQELRQKNFVSQAALEAKQSTAQAAEAQARLARNQAGYATLSADAAGVIAAVLAEPGQVLGAGQAVFRVARDGEREIAIALPEAHLARLKVGARGTAWLWSTGELKPFKAVLRELSTVADGATRTFAARVALPEAPADLPLGLTASVGFERGEPARIVVPLAAIIQHGEQATVWVIGPDQTLTQRGVEIEKYSDEGAMIKAGLMAGETIVAAGAFKLVAGEKVRIATP